jgi:REP element-mobilizing transposase RayT
MSYTRLLYHIVFRTKYGRPTIPEAHEKELYAYIMGIVNNKKSKLYRIGGTENHIHLLVDIHPSIALSDFVRDVKEYSSKWLAKNPNFPDFERWAISFAAFSYGLRDKQMIYNYIKNQKSHHKTVRFEEEYRRFLTENGVAISQASELRSAVQGSTPGLRPPPPAGESRPTP